MVVIINQVIVDFTNPRPRLRRFLIGRWVSTSLVTQTACEAGDGAAARASPPPAQAPVRPCPSRSTGRSASRRPHRTGRSRCCTRVAAPPRQPCSIGELHEPDDRDPAGWLRVVGSDIRLGSGHHAQRQIGGAVRRPHDVTTNFDRQPGHPGPRQDHSMFYVCSGK